MTQQAIPSGQQLAPYLRAQRSSRWSALLAMTALCGLPALAGGAVLYGVGATLRRAAVWWVLGLALVLGASWVGWHWRDVWVDIQGLLVIVKPLDAALRAGVQAGRSGTAAPATDWKAWGWGSALAIWGVWRWGVLVGIPLIALYLRGTRMVTLEQQEQRKETQVQQIQERQRVQAIKLVAKAPLHVEGRMVVGTTWGGDLAWTAKGWATYPADVLGRHLVLIGASGQGKSETAIRLAAGTAQVYGWQVFFLDAKGDSEMARRFWAAMTKAGKTQLAQLPERPFDIWRGDATAILNRLLSILDFTEPYYRDLTKMVLSLAIDAPCGPPRASSELLRRLNKDVLAELYKDHPDWAELQGLKDEHIAATYNRYRAFFRALRGQCDGDWAWEDVDAGYLLLDGLALKDQSISLGRVLLEDFGHYVSRRKDVRRRVLLIVDEFSALAIGGTDAASLFERVRSYGASVVVTSQSYAGLGLGGDRILGAAAAVMLHQCPDGAELVARGGTVRARQQRTTGTERMTMNGVEAYATGQVLLHDRDELKVAVERVQQLGRGDAVIIAEGRAMWLRVKQVLLDQAELEAAATAIAAQAAVYQTQQDAKQGAADAVQDAEADRSSPSSNAAANSNDPTETSAATTSADASDTTTKSDAQGGGDEQDTGNDTPLNDDGDDDNGGGVVQGRLW